MSIHADKCILVPGFITHCYAGPAIPSFAKPCEVAVAYPVSRRRTAETDQFLPAGPFPPIPSQMPRM